ncbi:hypothetical protein J6590_074346 [Homalodisca vitripennis]|nr:hypothetical protein J6590_074346 [Homalodisca vitripennis]
MRKYQQATKEWHPVWYRGHAVRSRVSDCRSMGLAQYLLQHWTVWCVVGSGLAIFRCQFPGHPSFHQ